MSHLKSFARLRTVATMLLLCLFVNFANAQVHTPRYISPTPNCGGFYEYLPQGYNSNETYPLLIFIHGLGELGQGTPGELPRILWNGIPKLINQGQFPASFTVNGQTHKFIVISPQFKQWPGATDVNDVINYAIQNYRVNTSRIYVTGLSMGGGVTWEYGGIFPNRVAAIVPVCGATYPDNGRAQQIAQNGVAVWATHNNADGTVPVSNTDTYVMYVNNNNPNPAAKKSIWQSASHDAWTKTYDPNYRENGLNVYEWMLQYSKGTPPPPPPPPAAPATVNLPGRVEAENFSNKYGVQTEATGDAAGGGQNVGWIDNGDWMDYSVNPTSSGTYTVKLRVATPNNGAQLQIRKADGTTLATVNVPSTGGYQTYQTVTATVSLTSGTQTLRVISTAAPVWNFNWMEFEAAPAAAPVPSATIFKIESENFSSQSGIQTEGTQDAGGGQNVGWIDQNDWMDYNINPATSGTYTVKLRIATPNNGAQLQIRKADGAVLSTVTLPNTWGYQAWQTIETTVNLTAGAQTIRIVSTASAGWNINWMEFSPSSGSAAPPPPASGTATKIEAEAFSSQSGIQTEWTQDAGGGHNVGWIDQNDWMDYAYNAPSTGTYTVKLRIATPNNGAQLQIRKSDGTVLSTVSIPNTNAYQIWQTISATVNLTAGQQTLRIVSTAAAGWNFNWMELTPGGSSSAVVVSPTKVKIEAEAFSSQSGIQTEGTHDAGGGLNVGWIDQNDWMDYAYNAPGNGTYNVSFRIATPNNGAQLQIRKADGSVLSTVNIPNTNAYQIWQTITVSVNLSAGQQTLRIVSTAAAGWNFNWMEIEGPVSGTSTASRTTTGETEIMSTTASTSAPLEVYPNPVTDRFVLKLNNDLKGTVKVSVVSNTGAVVKEFSLNKASEGVSQFYLSIGTLPAGSYILKAQMENWSETKQIIKQ